MQQTAEQTAPSLPTASAFAQSNIAVSTLVILALMSGWAIYLYFGIGSLIPSEVPSKPPNRTDTETPNPTTEAESSVVNYEEAEEAFVLDLQRCEIQERIEATRALLENARYSVTRFRKRIDDLRTSEAGRRLATPDAAGKANFLFHFPGQVDLANVEDEMLSVEQALKITHQPLVNFGQLVEKLIAAEVEIERSSRRCADANHAIDQLLSENQATQPITLQEAIQQLRQFHSHAVQRQVDEKIAAEQARQEAQLQGETERYNKLRSELTEATHKYDSDRNQCSTAIRAGRTTGISNTQDKSDRSNAGRIPRCSCLAHPVYDSWLQATGIVWFVAIHFREAADVLRRTTANTSFGRQHERA